MEVFEKPSHIVENVTYQFATMFLDMRYSGRHSKIYIPIEEGLNIIKQKFEDCKKLNKILSKEVGEISERLKKHNEEIVALTKYLKQFKEVKDVRTKIAEDFGI